MPTPKEKSQVSNRAAHLYAVQCGQCLKWRVIPTQEEFEDIRSTFLEKPFYCNWKTGVSCDDNANIEYDSTKTWVIDKPNLPKTPAGFKRKLVLRRDFSKLDAYYITPNGKKLRSLVEVATFLGENPEYEGISTMDFSFQSPKIMDHTIPDNVERKSSASASKRRKL